MPYHIFPVWFSESSVHCGSKPSCSDTRESGASDGVVPCDTTHVKIEQPRRVTDELTTTDDAASVARHPGMVSSSDAGLPPFMSIMPPAKRVRYCLVYRFTSGRYCLLCGIH